MSDLESSIQLQLNTYTAAIFESETNIVVQSDILTCKKTNY